MVRLGVLPRGGVIASDFASYSTELTSAQRDSRAEGCGQLGDSANNFSIDKLITHSYRSELSKERG